MSAGETYGLLARFASVESIVAAARQADARGYRAIEAFTPFPVPELGEIVRARDVDTKACVLAGALLGAAGGYFLQWYTAVHAYPFDIGGRPLHSWPAFVIVTFELAVLGGALAGFFGMLALNGLPRLNHPVLGARCFHLASRDRFFLLIERRDPAFDARRTRQFLEGTGAEVVEEVDGK